MPDVMRTVEIVAGEEEVGGRIDRVLGKRFYPEYSRSYLTCMIEAGDVLVNGKEVRKNYRLAPGDVIRLFFRPRVDETPEAEAIPLRVLYEDEHLVVVDKPDGMVIHPGTGVHGGTLVNALLHRYPEIAKVGIAFRPGIVHRLDRETSGVLVVARTNLARYHLVDQFKSRLVQKEYRAVVAGVMPYDSDYVDLPIAGDPKNSERMRVDRKTGKPASTFYEVIERFEGFTYVKVLPHTGRTHQIRVHLWHLGFPVVADPLYGRGKGMQFFSMVEAERAADRPAPALRRQALHAHRLSIHHPVTGEAMTFTSPLPADMEDLLAWLRAARERDR